jgi:drug/metabolite transporter (DMT)-like permease
MISARTLIATGVTLIAFASNSILCRLALAGGYIDPATFTEIRLVSGIVTLLLVVWWRQSHKKAGTKILETGSWFSGAALFLYAIAFSYAYVSLDAGTGALILFGAVQVTMIGWALFAGEHPRPMEWVGLIAAFLGLVYLVSPGLSAPSPVGSALMAAAGIAWGVYSLRGRGGDRPMIDTAGNFLRTLPGVAVLALLSYRHMMVSAEGIWLAVLSGAVASGLGYVIWYVALKGLSSTQAATVQLAVPVIAGLGGVVLLNEALSLRLVLAAAMILGGIAVALAAHRKAR